MATGSGALLDRLFGVAPRDHRDTTAGFFTLFFAMSGHSLMEAARDTLFLQSLPPTRLPWAYLAIAALTLAGSAIQRRFLVGVSRRRALRTTLLVGAAISSAFALVSSLHSSEGALLAFYTWTGVLATTIVVQFWLLAGGVLDFGQAKRAFALLGAGGLLGAVFGSVAAAGILMISNARALPLAASGLFVVASVAPSYFSPEHAPVDRAAPTSSAGDHRSRDRYLYRVFALVLLGTVTVTLVDYLFKSTVAREVPRERLGEFFSRYYAVINATALGLELFVTPRLLRAAGVHRTVLLMPALLLVTSLGFAAGGTLAAVLLLRGADGSLRHSVNRVGIELLHLPLDGEFRTKLRTLSEAGGLRAGQALASLFVLTALAFGFGDRALPWAPVVLSTIWLAATLRLEGAYVARLRRQVTARSNVESAPGAELDQVSERALVRALGANAETEVLAALDTIIENERGDLLPLAILAHPSPTVVTRALQAKWDLSHPEVKSAVSGLLGHADSSVRVAALRRCIAQTSGEDLLARSVDDPSAAVRVTALVGLGSLGAVNGDRMRAEFEAIVTGDDAAALRALARAMSLLPARDWAWLALRIAEGHDAPAAVLLAEAIAEAPDAAYTPALLALLARREARSAARRALVSLGAPALEALARALEDRTTPAAIRIHLPRTIGRFHDQRAAAILQGAFVARQDDAVGFKILRGLGRLRSDDPRLPVDRTLLESAALRTVERAVVATCWRRAVEIARAHLPGADDTHAELLSKALAEETGRALERTFRVMHILEPGHAFQVMFAATRSDDPDVRARGREMIEHLAPPALKRALLALLDEAPVSVRLQRPLGFALPAECLGALRLSRPLGTPSSAFQREVHAVLAACLAGAARHSNPLLRTLAVRYARTNRQQRYGVQHAG